MIHALSRVLSPHIHCHDHPTEDGRPRPAIHKVVSITIGFLTTGLLLVIVILTDDIWGIGKIDSNGILGAFPAANGQPTVPVSDHTVLDEFKLQTGLPPLKFY